MPGEHRWYSAKKRPIRSTAVAVSLLSVTTTSAVHAAETTQNENYNISSDEVNDAVDNLAVKNLANLVLPGVGCASVAWWGLNMVGMNSIKKFLKWIFGLLLINFAGLILITLYSAYYSFGTMIFGVHTEAAIKDFWNTEFITAVPFIIGVNLLAISTALFRMYKNKKKKTLS